MKRITNQHNNLILVFLLAVLCKILIWWLQFAFLIVTMGNLLPLLVNV